MIKKDVMKEHIKKTPKKMKRLHKVIEKEASHNKILGQALKTRPKHPILIKNTGNFKKTKTRYAGIDDIFPRRQDRFKELGME